MAKTSKDGIDLTYRKIASLRQQDKEYNESYLKWRMEHKDDVGFYLADQTGEYTYRQGEGFLKQNPENAEACILYRVHTTIAAALILSILVRIITCVLPYCLSQFGITADITSWGYFSGNTLKSAVINYITQFPRYLVPLIFVVIQTKMPVSLTFPMKISNKPLFLEAIPAIMFVYGISSVFSDVYYFFLGAVGVNTQVYIPLSDNKTVFILNAILVTVFVPILNELLLRGVFLQMLKQFGDGYALMMTAVLSAVLNGSVRTFMFVFTNALLLGYFCLRTGSIITPIIMKMALASLSFWMPYLKFTGLFIEKQYLLSYIITTFLLAVGGFFTIMFVKKHSDKISLPVSKIYLSTLQKALDCVTCPTVIIFIAIMIVYHLVSASVC